MIGWVILLVVLLLLLLPISGRFRFDGESRVVVRYAGIPVWRFTSAEKAKKEGEDTSEKATKAPSKTKKKKKPNPLKEMTAQLKEDGVEAVTDYVSALLRWLGGTVRRVLRILWFGRCTVQIAVGTPEASDTALRYGKACAVLCPAAEVLRENLHFRRLTLTIEPDFLREKDAVWADIRVCVLPITVLWAAIVALFAYIGVLIKQGNPNERKDVEHG